MKLTTQSELWAAYAAGETSPGLSLLCATQVSIDAEGASFVALAEEVAGRALRDEPAQAGATMDLEAMMARLAEPEPEPSPESSTPTTSSATSQGADASMPAVLRAAVGCGFDAIPWKFRLPGLSEHILADFQVEKVSLLRGKPGARIPQHTHRGVEATLVLGGALQDGERVLRRGDVSLCGAEHDHHPQVAGDEMCYCLIVVDGGLRFTGAWGPALNLFGDGRPRG